MLPPRQPDNDISELFRLSAIKWAEADGEARTKDAFRKRVFAQLVIAANTSVAAGENQARIDRRYEVAEAEAINAETAANIAKAEMEAIRVKIDIYRTRAATRRAEMMLK